MITYAQHTQYVYLCCSECLVQIYPENHATQTNIESEHTSLGLPVVGVTSDVNVSHVLYYLK